MPDNKYQFKQLVNKTVWIQQPKFCFKMRTIVNRFNKCLDRIKNLFYLHYRMD